MTLVDAILINLTKIYERIIYSINIIFDEYTHISSFNPSAIWVFFWFGQILLSNFSETKGGQIIFIAKLYIFKQISIFSSFLLKIQFLFIK